MDTNRLPKQALQYKPKERRNIGWPRKRWRDQLHLDYQGTGNTPKISGTGWWWWWWWWWYIYIYTYVSDSVEILYELLLLSNDIASETFWHKSEAVFWLEIYRWDPGLAVTERIRERNILQFSFQRSSSSLPVIFPFSSLSHSSRRPWLEI